MEENQKILAVKTAIREYADWTAMDCAAILWSMIDNISFSQDNRVVRARWKAKLLFNTTEETGIAGTSIPEKIYYEEEIVELQIIEEDAPVPTYFVAEWGVQHDGSVDVELTWDDEEITQEDIDLFWSWQDKEELYDELIEQFGTKNNINLNLFPQRLRTFLEKCLDE